MQKSIQQNISLDEIIQKSKLLNKNIVWKRSQAWLFYWYVDEFLWDLRCRYIVKWLKSIPSEKGVEQLYIDHKQDQLYF